MIGGLVSGLYNNKKSKKTLAGIQAAQMQALDTQENLMNDYLKEYQKADPNKRAKLEDLYKYEKPEDMQANLDMLKEQTKTQAESGFSPEEEALYQKRNKLVLSDAINKTKSELAKRFPDLRLAGGLGVALGSELGGKVAEIGAQQEEQLQIAKEQKKEQGRQAMANLVNQEFNLGMNFAERKDKEINAKNAISEYYANLDEQDRAEINDLLSFKTETLMNLTQERTNVATSTLAMRNQLSAAKSKLIGSSFDQVAKALLTPLLGKLGGNMANLGKGLFGG